MPLYPLYGGAVAADLPSNLIDASQLREIPDTQEVFILESNQNVPNLDLSIIFDLLESVQANTIEEILQIHIKEISEDTKTVSATYQTIHNTSLNKDTYFTYFVQNSPKKDKFALVTLISLIQLERADTDVLISVNVPFLDLDGTKSQEELERELSESGSPIGKGYKLLKDATTSYTVKDWSLFG